MESNGNMLITARNESDYGEMLGINVVGLSLGHRDKWRWQRGCSRRYQLNVNLDAVHFLPRNTVYFLAQVAIAAFNCEEIQTH